MTKQEARYSMTKLVATPARPFSFGVDTITTITPQYAQWLKANGYSFVCRYLNALTPSEVLGIVMAGLAIIPCTYADRFDPAEAIQGMNKAGLPFGTTVFLDVEGLTTPPADYIAKLNTWFRAIRSAGFDPGMYVGAGALLHEDELGALACDRYWHSCSDVPRVTNKGTPIGYCMRQLRPPNTILNGVQVDIDVIEEDYRGRVPSWALAA